MGGARVRVDEVAEPSGTIDYELMCALARRVPVSVDAMTGTADAQVAEIEVD